MKDGKDKFYRNLELDDELRKILKWYRSNRKSIENLDTKEKKKEEN